MNKKIISASILSADFACLGEEVKAVIHAGADSIHFDVMDHHFVPNLSFGALVCHALRNAGITASIDVHLMVRHPNDFIKPFADAGASLITVHPETVRDVKSTLKRIRSAGMKTGIAINPDSPLTVSSDILRELDLVLLMSVYPGFAGQNFIPETVNKIKEVRKRLDKIKSRAYLGVDGGVNTKNIREINRAGADFFVVGSALFHASDYQKEVATLRRALEKTN